MTEVKICGLSEPVTLDAAVKARADHIGFMFFPASPRNVTPALAANLAARVPNSIGRVGVFVDADNALLEAAVGAGRLSAVQLHGQESASRVAAVRERFGVPVWKAVAVRTRADIEAAKAFRGVAERLLFDAKAPEGEALPGGNGLRFDWHLLEGIDIGIDWVLSGGLDADSVGEAIRITKASAVDVSSGVEDARGVKSVAKIAAFVNAVRQS